MKPFIKIIFLALVLLLSLAGCAEQTETITPTATSGVTPPTPPPAVLTELPVVTFTFVTPTIKSAIATNTTPLVVKTLAGTSIPPIVLTQVTPEDTPTPEPTVKETYFPNSLIQIIEPGQLSQIASPMKVVASVYPGYGNLVGVQLIGEDGRLIHDRIFKMVKSDIGWVNLLEEIKFEIPTAGENAMLVITTRDEFDRRITQSAIELFLMQIGKSDINKDVFIKEPFVVQTPKEEAVIKGGVVHVVGYAHAFNSNPIILELLTESGGVMETQIVKLPRNATEQNYVPFSADIPYSVDIKTPVRLSVRQRSTFMPSIDIALSSRLLTLQH